MSIALPEAFRRPPYWQQRYYVQDPPDGTFLCEFVQQKLYFEICYLMTMETVEVM